MIPCANPQAQFASHRADIEDAIQRVLNGGRYILGPEVEALEQEFAALIGCRRAVGLSSGTDALQIALRGWGIGRGDEVITVSHTAVGTVAAIEMAGARPVLVDIDPRTMTIDPAEFERAISRRTRAVIPVHLYGTAADLDALRTIAAARNIKVLEDCAQATGAQWKHQRLGGLGDAGAFSFYPTKNLGAIGDGGMLVTNDETLADQAKALREYGWHTRYVSDLPGCNARLDELQAAIVRAKLPYLDADNARRQAIARLYNELLPDAPVTLPAALAGADHVYHQYVIRCSARDPLRARLFERNIQTIIHYPRAVHQQPAYQGLATRLPATEATVAQVLSLPMFPELSDDQARQVAAAVCEFFKDARQGA